MDFAMIERHPRGTLHFGMKSVGGAPSENSHENSSGLEIRNFLPLFIIIGIGCVTGILFLVEKLREKYTEKDDENMDAPPRYADLEPSSFDLNREVPAPTMSGPSDSDEIRPPTYDTATRDQEPPTYEFVNHAFEEDPPAYEETEIQTNATYVNHMYDQV